MAEQQPSGGTITIRNIITGEVREVPRFQGGTPAPMPTQAAKQFQKPITGIEKARSKFIAQQQAKARKEALDQAKRQAVAATIAKQREAQRIRQKVTGVTRPEQIQIQEGLISRPPEPTALQQREQVAAVRAFTSGREVQRIQPQVTPEISRIAKRVSQRDVQLLQQTPQREISLPKLTRTPSEITAAEIDQSLSGRLKKFRRRQEFIQQTSPDILKRQTAGALAFGTGLIEPITSLLTRPIQTITSPIDLLTTSPSVTLTAFRRSIREEPIGTIGLVTGSLATGPLITRAIKTGIPKARTGIERIVETQRRLSRTKGGRLFLQRPTVGREVLVEVKPGQTQLKALRRFRQAQKAREVFVEIKQTPIQRLALQRFRQEQFIPTRITPTPIVPIIPSFLPRERTRDLNVPIITPRGRIINIRGLSIAPVETVKQLRRQDITRELLTQPSTIQISGARVAPVSLITPEITSAQIQRIETVTAPKTVQRQKVKRVKVTKTKPKLIRPKLKKKIILPKISLPKPEKKKFRGVKNVIIKEPGYGAFIKKSAKSKEFVRVPSPPLTRKGALGLGYQVAATYKNRSGKVKRVSGFATRNKNLEKLADNLRGQFRSSKSLPNTFTEKTSFAIDTIQEKREITFQGIKASRRKRVANKIRKKIRRKKK